MCRGRRRRRRRRRQDYRRASKRMRGQSKRREGPVRGIRVRGGGIQAPGHRTVKSDILSLLQFCVLPSLYYTYVCLP